MADLQPQAPQQPNPQTFLPVSAPSVQQTVANYRASMQAMINSQPQAQASTETSLSQNPFAPDQINPKVLSQEEQDHQAWLQKQPVAVQAPPVFSDEAHSNVVKNMQSDPALKEIDAPFHEVLDQLVGYMKQTGPDGQPVMTLNQALGHLQEAEPMIKQAVWKHHGPHSPSYNHNHVVDPDLHDFQGGNQ